MPDPIDAAWEAVLEAWDDPERHRAFVGACAAAGRLPEAGRRYRQVRDQDPRPERREEAARQIDRLFSIAMQGLEATRTEPPKRTPRVVWVVALVVAAGLMVTATWLVLPR